VLLQCVVAVCCRVLLQSVFAVCCRCATNFRGTEALSRTYSRVKMWCTLRCVAGVLQVCCSVLQHVVSLRIITNIFEGTCVLECVEVC